MRYLALISAIAILATIPLVAQAEQPQALSGWSRLSGDGSEEYGILLSGRGVTYSSPVIGEIDGDSSNGLETAVGGADGILYAYRADGSLLWSVNLPNYRCNGTISQNKLLSTPAVGTLFGDGIPYVVIGYGGVGSKECGGGIAAYRGTDGRRRWHLDLRRFAKRERFGTLSHTVFSTPTLADTDGNGTLEIGFGSFDRNVYLLESTGKVRWYYNAADTIWSSAAFANIDSTPELEMIIGTDISQNKLLQPPTENGGYVYALKTSLPSGVNRRRPYRHTFRSQDVVLWQTYLNQVVYSAPVIADVLPDNDGAEIIVGSGCFFPQGSSSKEGAWAKVLKLSNGRVLQTLNAPACFSSSVAIGDIDEDGVNEVVATVNGSRDIGGDGSGRIVAWDAESSEPKWSIVPRDRARNDSYIGNLQSPIIADLDGNGSLEVIAANGAALTIVSGSNGAHLTCDTSDCESLTLRLPVSGSLRSTPAAADLNQDGALDLVIAGGSSSRGILYGWTEFAPALGSSTGTFEPFSAPWPMARGNAQRSGIK